MLDEPFSLSLTGMTRGGQCGCGLRVSVLRLRRAQSGCGALAPLVFQVQAVGPGRCRVRGGCMERTIQIQRRSSSCAGRRRIEGSRTEYVGPGWRHRLGRGRDARQGIQDAAVRREEPSAIQGGEAVREQRFCNRRFRQCTSLGVKCSDYLSSTSTAFPSWPPPETVADLPPRPSVAARPIGAAPRRWPSPFERPRWLSEPVEAETRRRGLREQLELVI